MLPTTYSINTDNDNINSMLILIINRSHSCLYLIHSENGKVGDQVICFPAGYSMCTIPVYCISKNPFAALSYTKYPVFYILCVEAVFVQYTLTGNVVDCVLSVSVLVLWAL